MTEDGCEWRWQRRLGHASQTRVRIIALCGEVCLAHPVSHTKSSARSDLTLRSLRCLDSQHRIGIREMQRKDWYKSPELRCTRALFLAYVLPWMSKLTFRVCMLHAAVTRLAGQPSGINRPHPTISLAIIGRRKQHSTRRFAWLRRVASHVGGVTVSRALAL
jgi:hypothetical protein